MASIQQLEKLHHIHRLFKNDRSLESVVASQRVEATLTRTEQLMKQRTFLREERRRLRVTTEKLEERKRAMKFMAQCDWMGEHFKGVDRVRTIRINVGGLVFEAYETTLRKDPHSLLSQLCDQDPPVLPDPDGCFVFNRDWWLFRYILMFLRDGSLPDDRSLLAQLYQEASFWKMSELMLAVEENKLHLKHEELGKDGIPVVPKVKDPFYKEDSKKPKKWWQTVPRYVVACNIQHVIVFFQSSADFSLFLTQLVAICRRGRAGEEEDREQERRLVDSTTRTAQRR
jgi:BTB/POZ domain